MLFVTWISNVPEVIGVYENIASEPGVPQGPVVGFKTPVAEGKVYVELNSQVKPTWLEHGLVCPIENPDIKRMQMIISLYFIPRFFFLKACIVRIFDTWPTITKPKTLTFWIIVV